MSNYVQTGEARRRTLTINKTDADGNAVAGYPVVYSILSAFTDPVTSIIYAAIDVTEYARLSSTSFLQRLSGFVNYVKALHMGIENDIPSLSSGCYVSESPYCVIGEIIIGQES